MPVALDIAGNFSKGQASSIARRRARQEERAVDYLLAEEADIFGARRRGMERAREEGGLEPIDYDPLQTNKDPWFRRFIDRWKERRESRVMPEYPMPESIDDEPISYGSSGRFQDMAIPAYQDGGAVDLEELVRQRRAAVDRSMTPEARAARQKEFRRMGINSSGVKTGRGGAIPREGFLRRVTDTLRGRGASITGRARALKGGALAGLGAIAPQLGEDYDRRLEKRYGFAEPTPDEGDPSLLGFLKYFGRRGIGYTADLGNLLTLGQASRFYRDTPESAIPDRTTAAAIAADTTQAPEAEAQPPQPKAIPDTPDEAIAQAAIDTGAQMADEAEQQSAPPGAIDFSQTDFTPEDIPTLPVREWVNHRSEVIHDLIASGVPQDEAYRRGMESVTNMQQQGFINYAQQALMHMQANNQRAAALALQAAYQYFPNGSNVRFGVQTGVDGQPVIVGMGSDEVTGEPRGQLTGLTPERLSVLINNFTDPNAFAAWTKDWRDEQFERQKFEVEKLQAQSQIDTSQRSARAYETMATAQLLNATQQGGVRSAPRTQAELDRANAAFVDTVALLGLEDRAKADRLMSLMSQIYERSDATWQYPRVIEMVRAASDRGQLDLLMQELGLVLGSE